jgi:hypothetical protein
MLSKIKNLKNGNIRKNTLRQEVHPRKRQEEIEISVVVQVVEVKVSNRGV